MDTPFMSPRRGWAVRTLLLTLNIFKEWDDLQEVGDMISPIEIYVSCCDRALSNKVLTCSFRSILLHSAVTERPNFFVLVNDCGGAVVDFASSVATTYGRGTRTSGGRK